MSQYNVRARARVGLEWGRGRGGGKEWYESVMECERVEEREGGRERGWKGKSVVRWYQSVRDRVDMRQYKCESGSERLERETKCNDESVNGSLKKGKKQSERSKEHK